MTLVDVAAAFGGDGPLDNSSLLNTDGLHPTEAGYQVIAGAFFEKLQATLERTPALAPRSSPGTGEVAMTTVLGYDSPVTFLTHWLITALALAVAAYVLPGIHVASWMALAVAALVLGFVNAIVRPVLVLITLPITILTLGLFYLVVNGLAFGLAAAIVPGFDIDSFGWAVLGALVVGLASWFVGAVVKGVRVRMRHRPARLEMPPSGRSVSGGRSPSSRP